MKCTKILIVLSGILVSCTKEIPKVKHMNASAKSLKNIKVVNTEDPICHMGADELITDTAIYKNKVYGFCSVLCKDEFKKNPEKYAQK